MPDVGPLKKKTSTGQTRLLQQDGHRSHTSKKVYDHLDGENVSYIADWPARSPDLNPIENLWAWLAKRVSEDVPQNADELEESIRKHWNGMRRFDGVPDPAAQGATAQEPRGQVRATARRAEAQAAVRPEEGALPRAQGGTADGP